MPGGVPPEGEDWLGIIGEAAAFEIHGGDYAKGVAVVAFIPVPAHQVMIGPEARAKGFGDDGVERLARRQGKTLERGLMIIPGAVEHRLVMLAAGCIPRSEEHTSEL